MENVELTELMVKIEATGNTIPKGTPFRDDVMSLIAVLKKEIKVKNKINQPGVMFRMSSTTSDKSIFDKEKYLERCKAWGAKLALSTPPPEVRADNYTLALLLARQTLLYMPKNSDKGVPISDFKGAKITDWDKLNALHEELRESKEMNVLYNSYLEQLKAKPVHCRYVALFNTCYMFCKENGYKKHSMINRNEYGESVLYVVALSQTGITATISIKPPSSEQYVILFDRTDFPNKLSFFKALTDALMALE